MTDVLRDLSVLDKWLDEQWAQFVAQAAHAEDRAWMKEVLTKHEDAEALEELPFHKGQQLVADLRTTIGNKWPHPDAMDSYVFLVTEVGEVGDALLRQGYGHKQNYSRNNEWEADLAKELGDVYLMLCTLATCLEINLGEALQERIEYLKEKHG